MNNLLSEVTQFRVLRKCIVAYYKMYWETLMKSLNGFEPHPREYYVILLTQIRTLAPIMYDAYDFFPLKQVYINLSKLYGEIMGRD